jgi:hypothetical protein
VPDADNLAMTPLLAPLLDYKRNPPGHTKWRDPAGYERTMALNNPFKSDRLKVPGAGNWEACLPIDLDAWRSYFESHPDFAATDAPGAPATNSATVVLTALKRFEPELAELKTAARRPFAAFPLHYDENFQLLLPLSPHPCGGPTRRLTDLKRSEYNNKR